MLQVKNIVKTYITGEMRQDALKGVSVNFRDNEFVSILGHSGSGKTTFLNIIGGLDRYTSGDLIINGVSTKKYKDADWDIYRNHRIGFVFQSYNLIPHQSVLANVEMALTLSGVPAGERRKRATEALEKVGLREHIHKKPNQMSGGQMQRVAIARALVNNPDILLADEPTGALDTDTSIQIMELLKEIAKDKLVIMVTHNPELAEKYSTRIVRLQDGLIISDTDPYEECDEDAEPKKQRRISMSFLTALRLSFNNLRTKKGRTILTAFAGSIGIIGIALILSLSTGMNSYINNIQRETMVAYPITINSKTFDMSALTGLRAMRAENAKAKETEKQGIYADYGKLKTSEAVVSGVARNNLAAFKKYLDDPASEIRNYFGENGVLYGYDVSFHVYSHDKEGRFIDSDDSPDDNASSGMMSFRGGFSSMMSDNNSAQNFSEIMAGTNGALISQVVTDSYEMLYGTWPEQYNEVILVLDEKNSLPAETLYQLGMITREEYKEITDAIENGREAEEIVFDYQDACDRTLYLVAACDYYIENDSGTYSYIDDAILNKEALLTNAVELKVTGVVRPVEEASNANISTAIAYTEGLTDYIINHTAESPVVLAQQNTPEINVLSGMKFGASTDEEKIEQTLEYIKKMETSEKAQLYKLILYYSAGNAAEGQKPQETETVTDGAADSTMLPEGMDGMDGIDGTELPEGMGGIPDGMGGINGTELPEGMDGLPDGISGLPDGMAGINGTELPQGMAAQTGGAASGYGQMNMAAMDDNTMAMLLDKWLANEPDPQIMLGLYEQYIGNASYEENMNAFGSVSYDAPSSISIYADNFENKEAIARCIQEYNAGVDEDSRISYTDYVAMMTSSLTTIINGISYVLVAFVAISLIVSCIMIGIITHISVMERTKEIGILRALGASKGNISQVFNAETFIIGCFSGMVGIGLTLLMLLPVNSIITKISGIEDLSAKLPVASAVILILVSIVITMVGGLLPAKKAAGKDPVIALRTE